MKQPLPQTQPKGRVLIVDDHPVFRTGLVRLLGLMPELTVCGEAGNAGEALDAITSLNPDLVLMDISLPGKSGLELLRDVRGLKPNLPVLIISMHEQHLYAQRVLRAGARGYVMKQERPGKIIEAIHKVMAGAAYLSDPEPAPDLVVPLNPRSLISTSVHGLTDREFEILRLTGEGRDSSQISRALHIDVKTIDSHRGNLKRKLGLKSFTEFVHYAARWVGEQRA